MSDHSEVFGICENLCKVPVYAKNQTYSKTEAEDKFADKTIYGNQHISLGRESEYLRAINTAVIGNNSDAYKNYSVAIGTDTIANGTNSLAVGEGVETSANGQLIIGEYNEKITGSNAPMFAIGNGINNSNRENIFQVSKTGMLDLKDDINCDGDIKAWDENTSSVISMRNLFSVVNTLQQNAVKTATFSGTISNSKISTNIKITDRTIISAIDTSHPPYSSGGSDFVVFPYCHQVVGDTDTWAFRVVNANTGMEDVVDGTTFTIKYTYI